MARQPKFIYFDLGNVLLNFSHRRAAEQMAAVSGASTEQIWGFVFDGSLQTQLECGQITSSQFCSAFRTATGSQVTDEVLIQAASDIFWLNAPVITVVGQLAAAGFRLGLLSNTCQAHWDFALQRFAVLKHFFSHRLLSFEFGAMKPDPRFFMAAIDSAGCPANEIFFTDDRPEHVQGAKSCGIDAVCFTTARDLASNLSHRGVRMNY